MTPGNRHVEAIALRCQAVLEAMRGRFEAAREILASGRATLEELGLTLELQESAMHTGIVELLDDRPEAAAEQLRRARDGFESLGVLPGAAQAAALLARALVEQGGHDAEAIDQTRFAEENCGENLKTTITWCSVRAQALARQGESEEAIELGRRAVRLAEPTDALADKADAAMALAGALLHAGDEQEAREVAAAARELYGMKGHTIGEQRAARFTGADRRGRGERVAAAATEGPPGRSELGDLPPERLVSEHARRIATHDLARCLELYAEDFVMVDHRSLGWEPVRGRESEGALLGSAFASVPDIENFIDEVLACDERVIAARQTYRGHALDGGGEIEVRLGIVNVVEDGVLVSADQYEYDDDAAMLTRFDELGGRRGSTLGDHPLERLLSEYARRIATHDLASCLELFVEEFVFEDHRSLSWEPMRGRERQGELLGSAFAAVPDIAVAIEVLACDERVIAMRQTWRGHAADGGGELEVRLGVVNLVEDGVLVSADQYEYDDDATILARYAELGGRPPSFRGDRAPERVFAEILRHFNLHDIESSIALYAEDWVEVDHRDVGWEERHGREGGAKMLRSAYETLPDLRMEADEVLACDDRVIALRCRFCGHGADGGGEAELAVGRVVLIEDGLWVRSEYYDYDDDAAMLARFEELSGTFTALGDKAPERHFAEYQQRIEAHDLAQCLEFYGEDWTCIDHRSLSWEPLQGLAAAEALLRSIFAVMPDARIELEEVLTCDERVIAARLTWRGHAADGGGEMAVAVGLVNVIEQGRMRSTDLYHPDDRKAMIARYAELGGGLSMLGDRAPERHFAEFARSYALGDAEMVLEQYATDWGMTDHRQLGWGELRGRDAVAAAVVAAYEGSLDMRLEVDEVIACDERVIALRVAYRGHTIDGGGAWEIPVGQVAVLCNGMWQSAHQYDADDREAMLARYAELIEATPDHAAASARATPQRHEANDRWEASFADDVNLFDLRPRGWGPLRGSDSVAPRLGGSLSGTLLHRTDWAALLCHPDGWFALALLGRQQIAYVEILSDEPAARERYRALVEDPEGAATVRLGIAWVQALNRRDRAGLKACLHDDMVVIDHRPVSTYTSETRADAYIELMLATSAVSDDVRWWWREAFEDHPGQVGRAGALMSGHLNDGGGSAEIRVDGVHVRRGDRLERIELFAPGTIAEQQSRIAELQARPPLGSQASPADGHRPDATV